MPRDTSFFSFRKIRMFAWSADRAEHFLFKTYPAMEKNMHLKAHLLVAVTVWNTTLPLRTGEREISPSPYTIGEDLQTCWWELLGHKQLLPVKLSAANLSVTFPCPLEASCHSPLEFSVSSLVGYFWFCILSLSQVTPLRTWVEILAQTAPCFLHFIDKVKLHKNLWKEPSGADMCKSKSACVVLCSLQLILDVAVDRIPTEAATVTRSGCTLHERAQSANWHKWAYGP